MPPLYLNQPSAKDGDQDHIIHPFDIVSDQISSFSSPMLFHSPRDQEHRDHHLHQLQHLQEQISNKQYSITVLSNCAIQHPRIGGQNSKKMELPLFSECNVKEEFHVPGEWMPSKMRIIRKMMNSNSTVIKRHNSRRNLQEGEDQTRSSQGFNKKNNSPCGVIRVCSNCYTTKTPLWRSGPSGPRSLCNACGIRQRKARRAMAMAAAAAAAGGGSGLIPAHAPVKVRNDKKLDVDHTVPFKKRCKFITAINQKKKMKKKLCSEDHVKLSLSSTHSFQEVFPQDERDAAILLMALSYGLVSR